MLYILPQWKYLGMTKKQVGALISDCLGSSPWFHNFLAVYTWLSVCTSLKPQFSHLQNGVVREYLQGILQELDDFIYTECLLCISGTAVGVQV